jgi:hypothetical protein
VLTPIWAPSNDGFDMWVLKCFWFAFANMVSTLVYENILSEQNKKVRCCGTFHEGYKQPSVVFTPYIPGL